MNGRIAAAARRGQKNNHYDEQPRTSWALWAERGLIAFALALSLLAHLGIVSCLSCRSGINLASAGIFFYGLLLAAHLFAPDGRLVRYGIAVAFSVHAGLVYMMFKDGHGAAGPCGVCLAIAAGVLILFIIRASQEPRNLFNFAIVCPAVNVVLAVTFSVVALVSRAALTEWDTIEVARSGSMIEQVARTGEKATVTVYELTSCPHCQKLRSETIPEISRRFGKSIVIRYIDAQSVPLVAWTPTIVVRGPGGSRVVEGFCTADELQDALTSTGLKPPNQSQGGAK